MTTNHLDEAKKNKQNIPKEEVISDYRIAYLSRLASLAGRKEVLGGRAKFGIFGDGKEVAQVALARNAKNGDWRSGYYRDQTFMMAIGQLTVRQFFAQLYADTNIEHEPNSGGRQMNAHFATRYYEGGNWKNQLEHPNTSSDISPTGGQMPRLLGLAYASKLYRHSKDLKNFKNSPKFSLSGDEVAFGMIGNASTSEGLFWETMNAAGVLQVPMAMCVWDDGYGISVPAKYQTTKESISEIMAGFNSNGENKGIEILKIAGWDYPSLREVFKRGIDQVRRQHLPHLFHVVELTQPQGHSTSGSHERYKSADRLKWEEKHDCITLMRKWMIDSNISNESELKSLEAECEKLVEEEKELAWQQAIGPIEERRQRTLGIIKPLLSSFPENQTLEKIIRDLERAPTPFNRAVHSSLERVLFTCPNMDETTRSSILHMIEELRSHGHNAYRTHLLVENDRSPLLVKEVKPDYTDASQKVDGRQIIQKFFDIKLGEDPRIFICGEDVGQLGGVNLEFEGLIAKYDNLRVTDTGIREATILGQGIGAAMRGLRPIVDIQYLDYLLFCLQGMSDDLATLHYRTAGGQVAPVIVRTKGHRLEGIWHTGSPIGMIVNSIRGMHFCVPRNMVQAAGLYNTLLQGDDPALVIEVLSGYRIKETLPDNIGDYTVPLGQIEILKQGNDITCVTYGANCRIAAEAAEILSKLGVELEIIDVQTLLPFDRSGQITHSLMKTNAVIFFDEDVPGGASAYMMQQVLEHQGGNQWLDSSPRTLTARPHRSAYASDADYYCKPSAEDLIHLALEIMQERKPHLFNPAKFGR